MRLSPPLALLVLSSAIGCVADLELEVESQEIVGGSAIAITDAPYQVSLQSNGQHQCGGAILTERIILTAAHCGELEQVVAGSSTADASEGQLRNVKESILAPGYSMPALGSDLAILVLDRPLVLNNSVRTIKPLFDEESPLQAPGTMASVTGWGATFFNGPASNELNRVSLPIVSNEEAGEAYAFNISSDQIAAGAISGRDSCQGDSGGPLVVRDEDGEPVLVGIVSWGEECGNPDLPGMYARVSSFHDFVDEHTGGDPTAHAGDDLAVFPNDDFVLDASKSRDVLFGVIEEYQWKQLSGPSATFTSPAKELQVRAPNAVGILEFELTVVDNLGNTSTDTVEVEVDGHLTHSRTPPERVFADPDEETPEGGCSTGGTSSSGGLLCWLLFALVVLRRRSAEQSSTRQSSTRQ